MINTVQTHETDHDQVDRDDVVEQSWHEKDQDARKEGNERRGRAEDETRRSGCGLAHRKAR
jgi:hypothetical protein